MKQETTLRMIYEWLLAGKKVRHFAFGACGFVHLVDDVTRDNLGNRINYSFERPNDWSLYLEPEEKKKWFRVASFHKKSPRPEIERELYNSKEDFLKTFSYREDQFHWIILDEVPYV